MKVPRGAGVTSGWRTGAVHAGYSTKRRCAARMVMHISPLGPSEQVVIHTRAVAWSLDTGILGLIWSEGTTFLHVRIVR